MSTWSVVLSPAGVTHSPRMEEQQVLSQTHMPVCVGGREQWLLELIESSQEVFSPYFITGQ